MFNAESLIALVSLAGLEIVLGVDNLVFLAIVAGRLPHSKQKVAYRLGLMGALGTRLCLLMTLSWIAGLSEPLITLTRWKFSGRDLILLGGGLFLLVKSGFELFHIATDSPKDAKSRRSDSIVLAVIQIAALDIVFSLDSVITAVGMSNQLMIMASAIIIAVVVMLIFAQTIGDFINRNPSMKTLALAFLVLVGVLLVSESIGKPIDKGMAYFAMGFSFMVELLNIRRRRASHLPKRTG